MLVKDDIQDASNRMATALNLYRQIADTDSVNNLADVLKSTLRDGTHYWQAHEILNLLMDKPNQTASFRQDLVTLTQMISSYLEDLYQLGVKQSDFTFVAPVVLEIGEALIPEDTSVERWFLFTELIPKMRTRIKEEMGVTTTGVRVRRLYALASPLPSSEEYRILLDEVLITDGVVYLDRKFCPHSREEIESAGIAIDGQLPGKNPRTGLTGYWIEAESARQVTEHKLELWDEPLAYVMQHLESVLRHNLNNFLGVDEVETLISTWGQQEGGASLIESALPDQASRLRLVSVLRTLVKEGVPITRWEEILTAFQSAESKGSDLSGVVRAVRLRLKDLLPGNKPDVQRLELPLKWEEVAIAKWLREEHGKVFFTPPPAEVHELLLEIHGLVDAKDRRFALVTRSSELRPFIRRLTEFEFPDLMALSNEELHTADDPSAALPALSEKQVEGGNRDE